MKTTLKNKIQKMPAAFLNMKKQLFLILISFAGITNASAADYEVGMQKGKEMFNQAKTIEASIDVSNYFERVAEANKNEWLPLYYAAYASLSTGFRQEKTDLKDEWYKKGLAFLERANAIKENESEILALEGYLQLLYISNNPLLRAPTQTGEAIKLLEMAKKIDPSNPRPWFIHGQNTLFTPGFFGGGSANAKPLLEKASDLYKTFKPANQLMPEWGKERCEKLLEKCYEEEKAK